MNHPDDDNGDVLRRLEAKGDDLNASRNIDFTVVFPDEHSGNSFAECFRHKGHTVSVAFSQTVKDFPWDVIVVKNMVPSHEEIGSFEYLLQEIADKFGGQNDGWGCITQVNR